MLCIPRDPDFNLLVIDVRSTPDNLHGSPLTSTAIKKKNDKTKIAFVHNDRNMEAQVKIMTKIQHRYSNFMKNFDSWIRHDNSKL